VASRGELAYVDTPLVLYRIHPSNKSRNKLATRQAGLFIVRKRLHEDPRLPALVGRREVRRRLFQLCCDIGYLRLEAGDAAGARQAFAGALRQRPDRLYLWALYMGLLLPSRVSRALRRVKQRLTHPGRQTPSGLA
jgi:hypothetical protein